MVIASPAGAYFKGGVKPVTLWLTEEYSRAGRGGMGAAKTGGNYASSLVAQQEATGQGCDQVVFLDGEEGRYVEELGGMNLYFVYADGRIVTPALGTILEGITRGSIIELAGKMGHQVEERRFGIDEWREGVASGDIVEVFACGTAAVVTPVGELDIYTAPQLAAALARLTDSHRALILEVAELTFVDSTGLKVLTDAQRQEPQRFMLSGECTALERVLELADMASHFRRV
jgi:branched-chain amino acid aminotransferase